ncbi:hypothetical protein N8I77_009704 [Diaporthe amygdali]|uniref:Uncharacterized protein n=1 Tax=Phomopsis amygdali TaxID=1214568 RepID=A0AAD9SD65_PHOAM|nr:hypothetical protein N8I77_009704 [Diaporthe amygdali]
MTSNNSQGLAFRPYKRLPAELQIQIIKEALDDLTKPLASYSTVDRVWQDIIEERSFAALYVRHHDIAEFGRICVGRRTRLVSKIRLYIREETAEHFGPASQSWNDSITVAELDASSVKIAAGRAIEQAFRKMFEIMTGWTTDRSRAVAMTYDLSIPWLYSLPHEGGLIKADFTGLAPVPVIGSIYNAYDRTDIHPVSMVQLLGFLPNVQYSMLTLGSRINGSAFHRGIAEGDIQSQPSLISCHYF